MSPLLSSRGTALGFLLMIGLLTIEATGLAAYRAVPLKMLPFDNKNQLTVIVDMPEVTTLRRKDSAIRLFFDAIYNEPRCQATADITDCRCRLTVKPAHYA